MDALTTSAFLCTTIPYDVPSSTVDTYSIREVLKVSESALKSLSSNTRFSFPVP